MRPDQWGSAIRSSAASTTSVSKSRPATAAGALDDGADYDDAHDVAVALRLSIDGWRPYAMMPRDDDDGDGEADDDTVVAADDAAAADAAAANDGASAATGGDAGDGDGDGDGDGVGGDAGDGDGDDSGGEKREMWEVQRALPPGDEVGACYCFAEGGASSLVGDGSSG